MAFLPGRHVLQGVPARITARLRAYQAGGCEHVALEVSYATFPAILGTLEVLGREIRPQLAR